MTGLQWSVAASLSILGAGFVSRVVKSDFQDIYNNAGSVDTVKPMTVEIKRAPTHLTLNKLPSLPQVLVRILDAVSQESADFQQLSSIIRQDSAISARLVAVANSSYYRRQHKCDTVDRALMCLGLETVRTLVITASVKQYFSFFDKVHQQFMARFWRRSLVSAHCAQTFASLTGYQNQSQAYLCGLLMDVGQLCLLAENDSAYLALWGPAGSQGELQLLDAERHAFAMTHAELGAALLDSWQMDNFMADAVRYHHATGADVNHAHHWSAPRLTLTTGLCPLPTTCSVLMRICCANCTPVLSTMFVALPAAWVSRRKRMTRQWCNRPAGIWVRNWAN